MQLRFLNRITRYIAGPDAQLMIGPAPKPMNTWKSLPRLLRKGIRIQKSERTAFVGAAILVVGFQLASPQVLPPAPFDTGMDRRHGESICGDQSNDPAQAALRLVCQQDPAVNVQALDPETIVVGFVGGFANPADTKHPEVLFAAYLREHYGSGMNAKIFSNHDANGALEYVMRILDTNQDGVLSEEEKNRARVIIFGHSWGASETVAFAGKLQHYSIPVLLTVQVDIVSKHGQQPSRIPSNVESAINFYQSEGFLQGRPEIVASEPNRTAVIGNLRSTYRVQAVNCSNYPWLARTFNKPHHEIENDPGIWSQIASLIDARISSSGNSKSPTTDIMTYGDAELVRTEGLRK
jgi:pimeloyl-ACP methyl ester carboxylesterase